MKSAFLLFGSLLALFFASQLSQGEEPSQFVWHATSSAFEAMDPPPLVPGPRAVGVWRP